MKNLNEFEEFDHKDFEGSEMKDNLKKVGFDRPTVKLTQDNFFDEIQEFDSEDSIYVAVQGPYMEMTIDRIIEDIQGEINTLPKEDREAAIGAIGNLWIEKIQYWQRYGI